MKKLAASLALAAAAGTTVTACGSSSTTGDKTLTVFAAASLKAPFTQLKATFEAAHPGVTVALDFDGSSALASQIQAGAPADVFASADTKNMTKIGSSAVAPASFATNVLEIATPSGNPAKVQGLADLSRTGLKLVVCAVPVPCGSATQKLAKAEHLTLSPVSEEQSVTGVLAKVESGQADAGIVYVTDVRAAGSQVSGVEIPAAQNVSTTYQITTLTGASQPTLAQEWVALVDGPAGQQVLRSAGFGRP